MSGQHGSRGYLYQGIASIFNACAENNWNKISVEYKTSKDKVDIALLSNTNKVLRAIQVKSSVNLFSKENIITWLTDIINDVESEEYQLILIGNCQEKANTLIKSVEKYYSNALDKESIDCLGDFEKQLNNKNINIILLPFDENQLMGVIRDSLNRYIYFKGYTIDFSALDQISYALLSLHMFLGTKGNVIDKTIYEKRITEWLISSANGGMKKNKGSSELKIMGYCQAKESLSDIGIAVPLAHSSYLMKYRNKLLYEGEDLIHKIEKIKLPAFEKVADTKPINIEKMQKYIKGDVSKLTPIFDDFPKYEKCELSEKEKISIMNGIKQYWDITVAPDFFYVGNLSKSTFTNPLTSQSDYNGTDNERQKNSLLHEFNEKIRILKTIDYFTKILDNVHLIPLCITNSGDTSDKNISITISIHNHGFHLFSMCSEIVGENRKILDVLADILIDKNIVETTLKIMPTANIGMEPEISTSSVPFIMPNPFGGRRRYVFDDLVFEWELYQAEENIEGIITYEFSSLRPGETKWLSPYIIIIPEAETFSLEYTILSESSNNKQSGIIDINTHISLD